MEPSLCDFGDFTGCESLDSSPYPANQSFISLTTRRLRIPGLGTVRRLTSECLSAVQCTCTHLHLAALYVHERGAAGSLTHSDRVRSWTRRLVVFSVDKNCT